MFGRGKKKGQPSPPPEDMYHGLRGNVLAYTGSGNAAEPVLAVVVETGEADYLSAIVAVDDGTASLYTSKGFGIIGAGEHEYVREANAYLRETAAQHLHLLAGDPDDRTPEPGRVIIRILTRDGRLSAEASENELGEGQHPLSAVFHAAHDMLSRMIQIVQAREAGSS